MPVELVDPTGGRAALEKLLAGHTARTQRLAAKVAKIVAAAVAKGEDPVQAVAAGMDAVGMAKAVRDTVATSVVQSVCIGYGIWPTVSALPPEAMGTLRTTALSGVWDDKRMTLSAQLHGTDKAMRDEIVQAVKGHVDAKASAWDAQRKIYNGYGFGGAIHKNKLPGLPKDLQDLADKAKTVLTPEDYAQLKADAKRLRAYADRLATAPLRAAYGQMADRLEQGLTHGLNRLVKTATEEKARYHASRILRTETANAWGQGFVQECAENPDVVAIRWKTSSAHKIFDVCDFCATANLYGMGPGVYPKAKLPRYCAHPHCFCNLLKVFLGQVPPEHDNVDAGGRAALAGMTDSQRARLLTIKGAQGFKSGSSWQGDLRNWQSRPGGSLSKGAQEVIAQVQEIKRFGETGLLLPGHKLTDKETDESWSKLNSKALLGSWQQSKRPLPSGLDDREAAVVYDYTSNGYWSLNKDIRSGIPYQEATVAKQNILNSSLVKMGVDEHQILFRGERRKLEELEKLATEYVVGHEFEWPAFTSASVDLKVASGFGEDVTFLIMKGKGTNLDKISAFPHESERLLLSGTRFRVLGVAKMPGGKYRYTLEQI